MPIAMARSAAVGRPMNQSQTAAGGITCARLLPGPAVGCKFCREEVRTDVARNLRCTLRFTHIVKSTRIRLKPRAVPRKVTNGGTIIEHESHRERERMRERHAASAAGVGVSTAAGSGSGFGSSRPETKRSMPALSSSSTGSRSGVVFVFVIALSTPTLPGATKKAAGVHKCGLRGGRAPKPCTRPRPCATFARAGRRPIDERPHSHCLTLILTPPLPSPALALAPFDERPHSHRPASRRRA